MTAQTASRTDVVLIGGGIMSATLGAMLTTLDPSLRIIMLEKADALASESSDPWNNAGTGHAGFCELNYMPDPTDPAMPAQMARQFHLTRQWWSHLVELGLLDPAAFVRRAAHVDVVFGERDVEYLHTRFETLRELALFSGLEYTEDPEVIAQWAPLLIEGRGTRQRIAATRHDGGTDVDFGALTRGLTAIITSAGGQVRLGHEVRGLRRTDRKAVAAGEPDGTWQIEGTAPDGPFELHARRVFVGAGGYALRLLQRAKLPEVAGYGVLPVGAAFLRCSEPSVVARHSAKVYGQAAIGAPPMSVPHLDRRTVDGKDYLLFGPYATFSTKLLKHGRLTDLFTTLRPRNIPVLVAAAAQSLPLVRYLIGELLAGPHKKFAQLQRLYPAAQFDQWELIPAGQRAQLVTPDRRRIGVLRTGTETIIGGQGSIAGLLGASPGASTAVPIMIDLIERCFPVEWDLGWREQLRQAIPALTEPNWDLAAVQRSFAATDAALGLARPAELPQ